MVRGIGEASVSRRWPDADDRGRRTERGLDCVAAPTAELGQHDPAHRGRVASEPQHALVGLCSRMSLDRRPGDAGSGQTAAAVLYSAKTSANVIRSGAAIRLSPAPPAVVTLKGALLRTRVWLSATPAVPWPHAVRLDLEREAEEDPHNHDHAQHGDALDGLIDNDRPDDVGDDQHLEAEQDAPT